MHMDPRWKIKLNEWSEEAVSALRFFEEVRLGFTMHELTQQFPVLLEHYLRQEIRRRIGDGTLRVARSDFHIQTMTRYLEESEEGVFVLERHLPPDMEEDRVILHQAFECAQAEH